MNAVEGGAEVGAGVRVREGRSRSRGIVRWLGTIAVVAGVGVVAWTVVVWRWQDPFTALYTAHEQHVLAKRFDDAYAAYHPPRSEPASPRLSVPFEAKRYRLELDEGAPVGRLRVPRLGLNEIVVAGTGASDLRRGLGWYRDVKREFANLPDDA